VNTSVTEENRALAFGGRSRASALADVTSALEEGAACVVVTGAPGAGKTALCRELAAAGDDRTFSTAILDSGLHADDVLRQLLRDFGLVADHPPAAVAHDTTKLAAASERFLLSLRPLGAHAVVIVDDAERVDQEVLESLQRLMLTGPPDSKLLRLILVGQESVALRLEDPALAGLLAQVGERVSLDPMETFDHRSSDVWAAAATGTSTEAVLVAPSASSNRRWLAAGVPLLVVGATLVWMMSRGGSGQPTELPTGAPPSSIQGAPFASGAATPEAGTAAPPAANSPPASAETRPAGTIATTLQVPPTGQYRIAVASFRSSGRAEQIAGQLREQQIAVTIRPGRLGDWFQVMAGPYATVEEAREVQRVLARSGFPDTEIAQPQPDPIASPDSASR
jgi:energy-coupling factor transporter ATP-binding protein EcfA2